MGRPFLRGPKLQCSYQVPADILNWGGGNRTLNPDLILYGGLRNCGVLPEPPLNPQVRSGGKHPTQRTLRLILNYLAI